MAKPVTGTAGLKKFLSNVSIFKGLDESAMDEIVAGISLAEFPEGASIVRADEESKEMFVIITGRVKVVSSSDDIEVILAELGEGDFFGEMALVDNRPRVATVISLKPTTCAVVNRETFTKAMSLTPTLSTNLLTVMSRRVRELAERATHPQVDAQGTREEKEQRLLRQGRTLVSDISDTLVIKEGSLFLITDKYGDVPTGNTNGLGLYAGDTRFLSSWELSLEGGEPVMLVSTAERGYSSEQELTNRDFLFGETVIPKETILVTRTRVIAEGLQEQISFHNFGEMPLELVAVINFAADFADIFEVRGLPRDERGTVNDPIVEAERVVLSYTAKNGIRYYTSIKFDPPPSNVSAGLALFRLPLSPLGGASINTTITVDRDNIPPVPLVLSQPAIDSVAQSYEVWNNECTQVRTDNEVFDRVLTRCLQDLRLLCNKRDGFSYVDAGVPWYSTLFGRDSILTALQVLAYNPALARDTLRLHAAYQAAESNEWRDSDPGKVIHETRSGEMALTDEIPFARYYGTIDATILYLILLGEYVNWTGDLDLARELKPNVLAALRWIDEFGDLDGDGYLEYASRSQKGLANQGWKDSGDAIMHADGPLAEPPIALLEVQGYTYAAKTAMAPLLRDLGETGTAIRLEGQAESLRRAINRDFWMDAQKFFAVALDGQKRQVSATTSNPGHALWSGVIDTDKASHVVERLFAEDMFSGWGIRTLSSLMKRYNPLGYHLGTVWPHDNSIIGAGLKRYGFEDHLIILTTALYEAALHFPYYRLPELYCGVPRSSYGVPISYPVACIAQAWAAGSIPFLLTSILGLQPQDRGRKLMIVRPKLPPWVSLVRIRDMRIGSAAVSLEFGVTDGRTAVQVLDRPSDLEIAVIL